MTELQMYHWIATGALTILITILGFLGKNVIEDMKTKLSKEEFAVYLQDAKQSRNELRESIVKLFEKMENHDKLDSARFEIITRDFNGGLNRISEKISDNQVQLLRELNGKADK
jgi:hypothetical protein